MRNVLALGAAIVFVGAARWQSLKSDCSLTNPAWVWAKGWAMSLGRVLA